MARGFNTSPGSLLIIVSIVIFLLAAFGVDVGDDDILLVPLGLAFFAAGHVLERRFHSDTGIRSGHDYGLHAS